MIRHVQALSRANAEKVLRGEHALAVEMARRFDGRVAWVGISNDGTSPVTNYRGPHLVEAFADVNNAEYPGIAFENPMRPEQAARIAAFVDGIAQRPDAWALLVHCAAGVSRSAAVAQWTLERHATMDRGAFASLHRHCSPNSYVLRLLREAGGAFRVNDRRASRRDDG
jgi:predicted protein tyrosine phosphatase